jgi:hypothetical protein
MMDVFSANSGSYTPGLGSALYHPLILILGLILNEVSLHRLVITVVKLAMLDATKLSSVCFW